jgi:hypothetical protein
MKKLLMSLLLVMLCNTASIAQYASDTASARVDLLLEKLDADHDDMNDVTWYHDKKVPNYWFSYMQVYMGKKSTGSPWLRLKLQYYAASWLFVESYVIKTDSNTYTLPVVSQCMDRDVNSGGSIREYYDIQATPSTYKMLSDIASSQHVKLRYVGKSYYKDRDLKEKEKEGIQNVLAAFSAMKGVVE